MSYRLRLSREILSTLWEVGMGKRPANADKDIQCRDDFCRDAQWLSHPLNTVH